MMTKQTDNPFTHRMGGYYTRQLFWEEYSMLPMEKRVRDPLYTLHKDREGFINFGKRYVELRDPTGYSISNELLGGYTHWTVLLQCRWFQAAKEIWDRELDALLASEAFATLREIAETGLPAQRLAAAKYIANKEYRKDKLATKGRPGRDMVEAEARKLAVSDRDFQEDLKRIQGVSN